MRCGLRSAAVVAVLLAGLAGASALEEGRLTAALTALEEQVTAEMAKTGVPGVAVAVVQEDRVVFARGFGVRRLGAPEPVDADTVFQLASVSKPLGSTVIAAVVGEGAVTWDSRIADLAPSFALDDPWVTANVTVSDLYAHRSGLPDHAGDTFEDLGGTRAEVLHQLRFQKLTGRFRLDYAYTNFGLTAAAEAVAKKVGATWEDLSEEKLYRPLGMTSTSSLLKDFLARPNRASGHARVEGKWEPKYQRAPDAQSPAGGASSSVNDLAKWMRLQLAGGKFAGRDLVSATALAETHRPQILTGMSRLTGLPNFYGLGWDVSYDTSGRLRLGHSGAFDLGAATCVYLVPAEKLGIVVLTNSSPVGLPEALAVSFLDRVLEGRVTQDWAALFRQAFANMAVADAPFDYAGSKPTPTPAAPLEAYTGTFENALFGQLGITASDGKLTLNAGPGFKAFPLTHWNRDIFTLQTEAESLRGTSGVFFELGPDGRARSVTVEWLNRDGQGTFLRAVE
jgi:CubicO group peptidase (beta-lactamase class C family)